MTNPNLARLVTTDVIMRGIGRYYVIGMYDGIEARREGPFSKTRAERKRTAMHVAMDRAEDERLDMMYAIRHRGRAAA